MNQPSILRLANLLHESKESPAGISVNKSLSIHVQNEKVKLIFY
jgi:hypothetical protein